ncbi:hypothetical protein Sjap_004462 [Stephania japonica]|uniref:Apyrase 7 n=1 Tax=Stephania japonica TaxID=461633 RepID=A0AAP0K3K3_9MAGN
MAGSHSSTGPSASSGLLLSGLDHVLGLSKTCQNHLRFSSSLQDFSTYRGLDPEVGDLDTRIDQSTAPLIKPRPLDRENGGSSFSKDKTFAGLPFLRRKWVRAIILITCLLSFFFLVFLCAKYLDTYWSQESNFYVVLDCGSTGTRVYVYQSSIHHKEDGNLPITLESLRKELHRRSSRSGRAYHRMETEPGFDKLVHNKSGLRAAIKPLLQWAEDQIPKHAHKRTSLFLYATAGVRRLQRPDSKWLLDNAWSILRKSPFLSRREWVKIISGMEEAYYGWVALNYKTGKLRSVPGKATFGALDLGGSSLQVTFETQEPVQGETGLNLSIGATTHHLSAYSLSGYGLNDAFDKSVVHLLKRLPGIKYSDIIEGNVEIKHPCLQSGYQEQYMCSHCALVNQDGGSPLGERSMGKGGKPGVPIKLLGAPQWEECRELAKVAVNLSEWSDSNPGIDCELQPCALRDGLPLPRGQFHAMSGFFVVFKFFNLTKEATLDDVLQKGQEFCEKTWEVAKNSVDPQPFIEQYCFRAPYVASLLREGLHIADSQVVIGSGSITWTLGVALLEAGKALSAGVDFQRHEILQVRMSPVILFILLITSLMLLICALSWIGNCIPRFFWRACLPLFRHNSANASSVLNIQSPFKFQRWSPISSGDGRIKMPLSPTVAGSQQRPFGMGHGLGGSSIQLMESSLHQSTGSVSHSYSSGSLGQMQFENNGIGSFWNPGRGQMRLQSRRSQSREDLNSSMAEGHSVKV